MKLQRIRPYLNNTLWLLAEKILRIVVGLFLFAYIARYLGPVEFGLLNYAIVFVGVSVPMIALGLNRLLVRELVKQPERQQELINSVFILKLLAALFSIFIITILIYIFKVGPVQARILILLIAFGNIFLAFDVIEFLFQAQLKSKYSAIYKSIAFFVASSYKLMLILCSAPLIYFAVATTLELFFIAILSVYSYWKQSGKSIGLRFDFTKSKTLLRESWPEIIAGIGTALCMRLDQIMLEAMVGIEAVGVFSVAARLSDAWYFIPAAIVSSTFPAIIAAKERSQTDYFRSLQNLFLVLVAFGYIIALCTVFFAPLIIDWLFGAKYISASGILMVYIWCVIAVAIGLCSGSWIFAEGRIILALYRMVTGAVSNALLNYLLIPLYGGMGAAIATVVSLFIAFYLFDLFNPSMRPLFFMKTNALLLRGLPRYIKGYLSNNIFKN